MNKLLSIDDSEEFLKPTDKPYLIPNKDNFFQPEFLNHEQEEEYQLLLRSIGWTDGFGLFFVECIPKQAERLIKRLKSDIPKKQIEVLRFTQPVDNLYNIVNDLHSRDNINILCIQGLEYSLNEYIKPGFGGEGDYYKEDSVPRILSHLNFQREKFRDSFNICFVFLLPKFAVKYFIRRAPDFYDWRSGTFEFSTDKDILAEVLQVIDKDIKEKDFAGLNFDQCRENILQIDSVLEEDYQDLHKKADLFFKKGLLLFKVNRPKDAVYCYDQALAINDNLGKVWYYRGLALFVSQRLEESIICFDRVLELGTASNDYNIYAMRGLALSSLGLLEDAIISLDKAIELKSDEPELWQLQARFLAQLKRYEDALSSTEKAIDVKSNDCKLWDFKARVLADLERYEDAIISVNKAIELKSDDYQLWQLRARFLANLERYEDALTSVDTAIELKSDDYQLWQLRASLLTNLERYEDALSSTEKAIDVKSDDYKLWNFKARVLADLERYEDAIISVDKAIELKSDEPELWQLQASLLANLERYEDAINSVDKAIELKSDDYQLWKNKARYLANIKRYKDAINSVDKALELKSDDYDLWHIQAKLLGILERYKEAIISIDKALELKFDDSQAWENKTYYLYKLKLYDEAIESIIKAQEINSEKSNIWNSRGFLLLRKYSNEEPQFNIPLAIHCDSFNSYSGQRNNHEESKYYYESLIYFDKALELKQDDKDCFLYWANRSYPLYYLEKYQEALYSCKQAIKINRIKYKESQFFLKDFVLAKQVVLANQGFILIKLERYQEAINSFKQVLKINSFYPDIHYMIASCYTLREKINIGESVRYLKVAISINNKYREWVKLDSNFDNIRNHIKFKKLIQDKFNE